MQPLVIFMISWFLIALIIAIPAVLIWYSGPSTRPPWLFRSFFLLIFLILILTALLSQCTNRWRIPSCREDRQIQALRRRLFRFNGPALLCFQQIPNFGQQLFLRRRAFRRRGLTETIHLLDHNKQDQRDYQEMH